MIDQTTRYGIGTTVDLEYARAVERTKEEVKVRLERVLNRVAE